MANDKKAVRKIIDAVASVGANKATGDSIIPGTTRSASVGVSRSCSCWRTARW